MSYHLIFNVYPQTQLNHNVYKHFSIIINSSLIMYIKWFEGVRLALEFVKFIKLRKKKTRRRYCPRRTHVSRALHQIQAAVIRRIGPRFYAEFHVENLAERFYLQGNCFIQQIKICL